MIDNAMIDALREEGFDAEQILKFIAVTGASEGEAPEAPEPIMAEDAGQDEDEEEFPMRQAAGKSNKKSNGNAANNDIKVLDMKIKNLEKELSNRKTAPPTETVEGATSDNGQGGKYSNITHRVSSKYDGMSAMDLAFLKSVMDATPEVKRRGGNWVPSEPEAYIKALINATEDEKVSISSDLATKFAAIKSSLKRGIKADELNYSTLTGGGDEYVAELWRDQLWRRPRLENPVFANSTTIDMPSNPYKLPIEGSDPTVYAVGETTDESSLTLDSSNSPIPDSKIGTSNGTMTAAKLALRVMLSEELNEDSIIPVVNLWREQAVRTVEDARDAVILSADSSATTSNINYDGTSATTSVAAVSRFLYGGGDGYLHLPLIDNTDMKVDMQGLSPTLSKIREARGKLNRNIFQKRNELVYYCDPETLLKLESLDEAIVTSINGVGSTFEGREVKAIDGIPVFPTAEMPLATSTGVVSATSSNNSYGRLLLVHKPSWFVGFRRNIRVTFDYLHHYDAHMMVVTTRMALIRRTTDVASLLYNIAV